MSLLLCLLLESLDLESLEPLSLDLDLCRDDLEDDLELDVVLLTVV